MPMMVPEEAHQRRDVGDGGQRVGAALDVRDDLERSLFDRVLDLVRTLVRAGETSLDDPSQRRGRGRVAELDGLINAVGHDQLLDLGHERIRVDVVLEEQHHESLDHDAQTDDGRGQDDVHPNATLAHGLSNGVHGLTTSRCTGHGYLVEPPDV
jgi:hypothetical protein